MELVKRDSCDGMCSYSAAWPNHEKWITDGKQKTIKMPLVDLRDDGDDAGNVTGKFGSRIAQSRLYEATV